MQTLALLHRLSCSIYGPHLTRERDPASDQQLALCTKMAAFGAFHHQPVCQWVQCHGSRLPSNAVPGGEDSGESIFIGRAMHGGDLVPGKVVPTHNCCYVSYDGTEHSHQEYQALVTNGTPMTWVPAACGSVPTGAIQGGSCANGEPLYIGRTFHDGTLAIGKVHPSHGCLYIPYGGQEHRYTEYEVFVCKTINF
ncbi:natterin-4-like isoform X1 [Amblyomma americanum]